MRCFDRGVKSHFDVSVILTRERLPSVAAWISFIYWHSVMDDNIFSFCVCVTNVMKSLSHSLAQSAHGQLREWGASAGAFLSK